MSAPDPTDAKAASAGTASTGAPSASAASAGAPPASAASAGAASAGAAPASAAPANTAATSADPAGPAATSTAAATAAEQVRRSMELLWGGAARSAPGPKPSLTLTRIIEAAITLADRDGIDGLSMRRVATELGVGTMSLYRYVPGKAELLALMLDRVEAPTADSALATDPALAAALAPDPALATDPALAPDPAVAAGRSWRETVDVAARGTYRLYLDHPWLLQVNWTRPVLGPNSVANMETYVRGLDGLGLSGQERIAIVTMVDAYVVGQARQRIQYEAVTVQSGLSDEEFWAQQFPYLEKAMTSGRYPAMAALDENTFGMGWEESFDFGLTRILDGIAVLVEARRSPST